MFAYGHSINSLRRVLVLLVLFFGTQALSATDELQLENELLLELRLDGERLGMDILGYQRGENFLLSLDELTNGLGFPISVDGSEGTASGWFISEDRGFSLDLALETVISDDKRWPIEDGEAVIFQGGLYVDTKTLQKWFPLQLSAVIRELYLNVEPTEPLPIQQRFNRRERVIAQASGYQEPQHPLQDIPYQFFSPHITKLRLGYTTVRQSPDSNAEYGVSYASLSRGDLGWMTSTLSLAGQSSDSLTGARLKLERTAFDGPLGLNHIELGDVDAGGFRGLLFRGGSGSEKKGGRFDNESVSLEGSQLPDWDVELYQNDQLIDIRTTGQEGRYLFEDVALQFGENRFKLKFFGPNGEIESREEFHFLGADMLQPGRISYEAATVQSGRTVFGVNDTDDIDDLDSLIYTGNFNIGVLRNLTASAGVKSLEKNGERLNYSNLGIGLSTSRLYGSVRYFDVPKAQNSVSTSLRTQLGETNLNFDFTQFFDGPESASSLQKWRSGVDITSAVFAVPIKLEINTSRQENNTLHDAVIGTTRSLSGSGQLSSSLWYSSVEERFNDNTTRTSQSGGQSSFHTTIRPWAFRLSTSYRFGPETEFLDFSANSSLRIEKNLTLDLSVRRNPTTDTTYYGGGVNWQLDQVAINARVSYDSDERWVGLITLSTALVHKPGTLLPRLDGQASANTGTVEVRVIEAANGDERERYAGVGVKGIQTWRHATTDKNGIAYLSSLPAHRQVDIELDESTLPEYELKSKAPGVSVISRPGSYAVVEFPIVRTAELEGHVVIAEGDDTKPVSRALLSLKTPEGEVVAQTRSAFDGFFLFDGIESGVYQISLESDLEKRVLEQPENVTVHGDSSVIRDLNFTLRTAGKKTIAMERLVQDEVAQQQAIATSSPPIPELIARLEPMEDSPVKQQMNEGTWFVQLGAYGSRELAQAFWEQVIQNMQVFQGKTPRYTQFQSMTRLLIGPGRTRDAANELCQQLKEERMDCIVRDLE